MGDADAKRSTVAAGQRETDASLAASEVEAVDSELEEIRELYTELASNPSKDYGWGTGPQNALDLGYKKEWIEQFPSEVWESNAAGGCPFNLGEIKPGDTVVDIGSGAGGDTCVAAHLVGANGKVFGVDVTPAMVEKTRSSAKACGFEDRVIAVEQNFEFPRLIGGSRNGVDWPTIIPRESVDVVISNNVINLMAAKLWCYVEARCMLKPGGKLLLVDCVRDVEAEKAHPEFVAEVDGTLADWVTGTVPPEEQIATMEKAGFVDVKLHGFTGYRTSPVTISAMFTARKPLPDEKK